MRVEGMKRYSMHAVKRKASWVFLLALALGLLPLLLSLSQEGAAPAGVIDKPAEESDLVFDLWMAPSVGAGLRTAEFVYFTINQRSAVYLWEIDPSGKVILLFPNRLARDNVLEAGTYTFPKDFQSEPFRPSGSEGGHVLQGIATPFVIALEPPPPDASNDYRILGDDPIEVRSDVLQLIEDHGIPVGSWAADWQRFTLKTLLPFAAPGDGPRNATVRFRLVRQSGAQEVPITPIFRPKVIATLSTGEVLEEEIRHESGGGAMLIPRDVDQVDFVAEALYHKPSPNRACRVQVGDLSFTRDPCRLTREDLETIEFDLTFVFTAVEDPHAVFVCTPKAPAVGDAVACDASDSGPRERIATYRWDFGDGTQEESDTPLIAHVYYSPNTYNITLTIVLRDGREFTTQKALQVVPPPPQCPQPVGAPVPRLCLSQWTGDFDLIPPLESDWIEVQGSIGSAVIVYQPHVDFPAGRVPAGLARLEFRYEFSEFPSFDAVRTGRAYVSVDFQIYYFNENPDLDTRERIPKEERFLVTPGSRPRLHWERTKSVEITVPKGTEEIRVQIVVSVPANSTGEKVRVRFSGFRWESKTCSDFLTTDKAVYERGEPVSFTFCNLFEEPIELPNTAPWLIRDTQGVVVFAPAAAQRIVVLQPNESFHATWDQRDYDGQLVPSGTYTLEFRTLTHGIFQKSFVIR